MIFKMNYEDRNITRRKEAEGEDLTTEVEEAQGTSDGCMEILKHLCSGPHHRKKWRMVAEQPSSH
jgi:hypothetical protein